MKKLLTIAFFVLIAAYALFQARFLILGPRITVNTPAEDVLVDAGTVVVSGTARNIAHLSLNDRQIYTDTEGRFEEKLIAHSGINIMKLRGMDRFGRESVKLVRIVAR